MRPGQPIYRTRWALLGLALLALPPGASRLFAMDLVDLVEMVKPAVVRIDTDSSLGSGVLVDDDGLVLTNFHVVHGARGATAMFESGTSYKVRGFLVVEPRRDIALLKIDSPGGKRALRITAQPPRVGEKVAAFGNPKGFSFTTSEGIVSALRSGLEVANAMGVEAYKSLGYDDDASWIQTTAPISGGNSGGPLVNMEGEVVGLNTWGRTDGQNLNFAISFVDLNRVMARAPKAPLKEIAKLPNFRAKRTERKSPDNRLTEFRLKSPSGRVFSFGIFSVDLVNLIRPGASINDAVVQLKHLNGSIFATVGQRAGILDGTTLASYENGEDMAFAMYQAGKRHGVVRTFSEEGDPVLYAQYFKGKQHGFSCFFEEGEIRLICEHANGEAKWVQLMSDMSPLDSFSDLEAARAHKPTAEVLDKLDKLEDTLKTNELAFKKQVKEFNIRMRKIQSARTASETQKRLLAEIDRENAANAAYHEQVLRRLLTRGW